LTGLDVIKLIVNLAENTPDFHTAAVISETISKIVPRIYYDIGSMIADAQLDENRIKKSETVSRNPIFMWRCTGKNLNSRINLIYRCYDCTSYKNICNIGKYNRYREKDRLFIIIASNSKKYLSQQPNA
jgi:hypothetical protein